MSGLLANLIKDPVWCQSSLALEGERKWREQFAGMGYVRGVQELEEDAALPPSARVWMKRGLAAKVGRQAYEEKEIVPGKPTEAERRILKFLKQHHAVTEATAMNTREMRAEGISPGSWLLDKLERKGLIKRVSIPVGTIKGMSAPRWKFWVVSAKPRQGCGAATAMDGY